MSTAIGFDVSHYQSQGQVVEAVKTGLFVFVKATQGTTYIDPEHDTDVAIIRAARRVVGHYHFAEDVHAALAEAGWFLASADLKPGDLVALDLERMNGTWLERLSYAVAWMTYVHAHSHATPIWYVNGSWHTALMNASPALAKLLAAFPAWYATAGRPAGQPGIDGPWLIHQFSTQAGIDHDLANHWPLTSYAVPLAKPPVPPNPPPAPHHPPAPVKEIDMRYVLPKGSPGVKAGQQVRILEGKQVYLNSSGGLESMPLETPDTTTVANYAEAFGPIQGTPNP